MVFIEAGLRVKVEDVWFKKGVENVFYNSLRIEVEEIYLYKVFSFPCQEWISRKS